MKPMRAPPDYQSGILIGQLPMCYDPALDKLDVLENFDESSVDPNTLCGTVSIYRKGCGIYTVYYFFDTNPALVNWFVAPESGKSDGGVEEEEDGPDSYCEAVCVEGDWFLTESNERIDITTDEDIYEKTGAVSVINVLLLKKESMPVLLARIEKPSAI